MADTQGDSLSIQISAEASRATKSLDALVSRLDALSSKLGKVSGGGLKSLSNGIAGLSEAMNSMKSIDSRNFTTLAKNINKLGNIDASKIGVASTAISDLTSSIGGVGATTDAITNISNLAGAINKLGYKSVDKAIANIPQLATQLDGLMNTLSKSPQVSQNLIDMTNALANLSAQGSKIGTVSKSMTSGINNYSSSARSASKNTFSLAGAIGKFWASYYLVIRGVDKLKDAVKSSMDYIETFNYFDKAFEQVASTADLSAWEDLGYDSAESYADSFSERAKELTAKMTGYNVDEKGNLTSTGAVSLGINPSDLLQYQAMFGQMASSMGVSAETSVNLSNALTQIGADLASIRNMNFEDVWTDMASGLAGMSRTLDKYGVNIRNVNLQQKLTELGINANIASLNQQDKALLRGIILLESTEYAWGDLADTIEQPANQLRLLENNLDNLSRAIGDVFLPIVAKALPYLNGITIALQRLFVWVKDFLGLETVDFGLGSGDNDLLSDIKDANDGLEDATSSAKKLKQQLQGFDELNVITTTDTSGVGAGTAGLQSGLLDEAFNKKYEEYQKAWEEAFAGVESNAQRIADNIVEIAQTPLFQGITAGIAGLAAAIPIIKGISVAFKGISAIVTTLQPLFTGLATSISLPAVAIAAIAVGLTYVFATNEEVRESFLNSVSAIQDSLMPAFDFLSNTVIPDLSNAWQGLLDILKPIGDFLEGVFTDVWQKWINPALRYVGEEVLPKVTGAFENLWNNVLVPLTSLLGDVLEPVISIIIDAFDILWKDVVLPLGDAIGNVLGKAFEGVVDVFNYTIESLQPLIETMQFLWDKVLKPTVDYLWDEFKPVFEDVFKFIGNIIDDLSQMLGGVIDFVVGVFTGNWEKAWEGVVDIFKGFWNSIASTAEGVINIVIDSINAFLSKFDGIVNSIGGIVGYEGGIPDIPRVNLSGYADGGYPNMGDIFVANEMGPELIGTINGRTAVASNGEITGIRDAVYDTGQQEVELLRQQNALLQAILEKEFGISQDTLYKSVRSADREFAGRTGRSGFAY